MDPALFLLAGLALLLLLQFSRVRRAQRQVRSTQAGLEVGAEVLTAAGMVATVVAVDDVAVTLESEGGHRSRWVRGSVIRVLPDTDPASARFQQPADTTGTLGTTGTPGTTSTPRTTSTPASDTSSGAVDDDGPARNQD